MLATWLYLHGLICPASEQYAYSLSSNPPKQKSAAVEICHIHGFQPSGSQLGQRPGDAGARATRVRRSWLLLRASGVRGSRLNLHVCWAPVPRSNFQQTDLELTVHQDHFVLQARHSHAATLHRQRALDMETKRGSGTWKFKARTLASTPFFK